MKAWFSSDPIESYWDAEENKEVGPELQKLKQEVPSHTQGLVEGFAC